MEFPTELSHAQGVSYKPTGNQMIVKLSKVNDCFEELGTKMDEMIIGPAGESVDDLVFARIVRVGSRIKDRVTH